MDKKERDRTLVLVEILEVRPSRPVQGADHTDEEIAGVGLHRARLEIFDADGPHARLVVPVCADNLV